MILHESGSSARHCTYVTYSSSICRCSESGKKRKTGREKFFNIRYVQSNKIFREKGKILQHLMSLKSKCKSVKYFLGPAALVLFVQVLKTFAIYMTSLQQKNNFIRGNESAHRKDLEGSKSTCERPGKKKSLCVFGVFLVELGILPLFTCTDRFGKGRRKQLSVTSKTFGNS